ncbi:hypothetical protein SAMN05661099_0546 [Daejeonella lutea]|uniref:Uncharacterized protein n=1 Tax=Daejeonella lutea TaxID=572036 RepID=A0A1T5ABE6_9SPHI|nr:hypothetical protein SAMN05661099_0546 [Daejeonella lutea]
MVLDTDLPGWREKGDAFNAIIGYSLNGSIRETGEKEANQFTQSNS